MLKTSLHETFQEEEVRSKDYCYRKFILTEVATYFFFKDIRQIQSEMIKSKNKCSCQKRGRRVYSLPLRKTKDS